jgi:heme-degrading monooxygenase HmoA
MITRVWRGWTTPQNAEAYQALLLNEIFHSIESRKIKGYRGITLGRRNLETEVEFITTMWFDSLADTKAFAGQDSEKAVIPPAARELLSRFDERAAHYEIVTRSLSLP